MTSTLLAPTDKPRRKFLTRPHAPFKISSVNVPDSRMEAAVILSLVLTLVPSFTTAPGNVPDVAAIENAVLAPRRALKSGQVELDSHIWDFPNGERRLFYRAVRTAWFDGNKMREDTLRPQADSKTGFYREVLCFADGHNTFWSDQILGQGHTVALDYRDQEKPGISGYNAMVDPRLAGLTPQDSPNFVHFHLESFIARADREPPSVRSEPLKGVDCWRVEFVTRDGCTVRYWVAPSQGNSVLRMEFAFTNGGDHYVDSVTSDIRWNESTGVWFPETCVYNRLVNDKPHREEKLAIRVASFNQPIAPEVFDLKGMNITPGTLMQRIPHDPRGEVVWDGKEIVPLFSPTTTPSRSWTRTILAINAVVLAIVAVGLSVWYLRKRRQPAAPTGQ